MDLVDLHSCDILHMSGLNFNKMITSESPDGTRVMLACQEVQGTGTTFSRLGLLNPETGVVQMLTREAGKGTETFWGWLDSATPVLTARDPSAGYYIYVYQFQE